MLSINKKKLIQQLAQKKHRDDSGLFVAEGAKLVNDLIRGGLRPRYVVGLPEVLEQNDYNKLCTDVNDCSEQDLKGVSQLKTPSRLIAIFAKPQHDDILGKRPSELVLLLDEIQDPGNMGTIIRVADWFGIRHIVCSDTCADAFGPKVIQATMGAIARVNVVETNLVKLLEHNNAEWHLPVYGTFLEGDNIYKTDLEQNGFIVMGNEGKGISDAIKPFVSNKLFVPPFPVGVTTSESLNVATATAVVCSEFRRRVSQ